ncbi:MAG: hypothetical protein ACXAE3_12360 [Candidatus Kariarchaeaceae archaeon]
MDDIVRILKSYESQEDLIEYLRTTVLDESQVDAVMASEDTSLIFEVINYQEITQRMIWQVFQLKNLDLIRELLELTEGEQLLPTELLDWVFEDESNEDIQYLLGYKYWLPLQYVKRFLFESDNAQEILYFIEYQALDRETIEELLTKDYLETLLKRMESRLQPEFSVQDHSYTKMYQIFLDKLLQFHHLPDTILEQLFLIRGYWPAIFEMQVLSAYWIMYVLKNQDTFFDELYNLLDHQLLPDEAKDYILANNLSLSHSLVRMQSLNAEQREVALSTGYENVITGVLEYQHYTDKERAELMLRFPEHRGLLQKNPQTRKNVTARENRIRRRKWYLDQNTVPKQ